MKFLVFDIKLIYDLLKVVEILSITIMGIFTEIIMSEPVNSLLKTVQADRPTGPNPKKPADQPSEKTAELGKDEVFLSEIAKKALETESTFDADKVNAIKKAIEEGSYPLDSRKIAESFIAMESLIGNANPR